MLTNLEIKNFRGLEHIKPTDLGKINIITGLNNGGKTSLLEALYLALATFEQLKSFPSAFRESQGENSQGYAENEKFEHFWK